jgi:hypothetical protein
MWSSTGLLFTLQVIYEYGEPWWNDVDRTKPKNSEEALYHFVLQIPKPGAKPGLRCERPATNRLSYGTANPHIRSSV